MTISRNIGMTKIQGKQYLGTITGRCIPQGPTRKLLQLIIYYPFIHWVKWRERKGGGQRK